jgi:hypothetical protein
VNIPLATLLSPSARLPSPAPSPTADEIVPELSQRAALAARNGFSLTAVVLDTLPDGRYKVAVADAQLALELPDGLQAGELLYLRPQGGAGLPAPADPLAVHAFETDLGATAQLVSRLATPAPGSDVAAAPIVTLAPLATQPGNAQQVAAGLRDAIATSGLFYESHLADWVDGSRSRQGIAREPQAALAQAVATAPDAPRTHTLLPQAESIVQRQLDVLEHRTALWQGEAWPGQQAEVRISEGEAGTRPQAGGEAPAWQASLRLRMRGLGDLEARVALSGKQARLSISAADPASAGRIAEARGDLARALADQGLTLAEAKVDHGVPAKPR